MMTCGKEMQVPQSTTAATARSDIAGAQPSTGRSLGEAIAAFRRGEPVLIRDYQISVLAVAAELVTEDNLHRLREISGAPARVVLTRRRARSEERRVGKECRG